MKKKIRIVAYLAFVLLLIGFSSCSKENQTLLTLSAHTWVVESGTAGGSVGDEYKFYDNRLFFQHRSGVVYDDGQWSFTNDYQNKGYGLIGCIIVDSHATSTITSGYDIKKLTDTELVLLPFFSFGSGTVFASPEIVLKAK